MNKTLKVTILDQEYILKTDEGEENVYRIAEYINERLKEIQDYNEGLSGKKMAILAAFHIGSDYFQLIKERDEQLKTIKKRTDALIFNIDSVIE